MEWGYTLSTSTENLLKLFKPLRSKLITQTERIAAENSHCNALLRTYFPSSSVDSWVDDRLKDASGKSLMGVSYVIKDNIEVKGVSLTVGLKPPLISECQQNAAIVEFFESNGAILLGSSNLDELCLGCTGDNRYYGRVVNPVNARLISGGSSSGSAVAVANGFCDVAIGSDLAGSTRIPAAVCQVIGLKLSPNVGLEKGVYLYDPILDSLGIFAGSFESLNSVLDAIVELRPVSGPSRIFDLGNSLLNWPATKWLVDYKLVLGLTRDYSSPALAEDLIDFKGSSNLHKLLTALAVESKLRQVGPPLEALPEQARALLLLARQISTDQRRELLDSQQRITDRVQKLLSGGLLLTPALSAEIPDSDKTRRSPNEHSFVHFLSVANLCGLPALVFHFKHPSLECPVALQLIGPRGAEQLLISAAKMLIEQTFSQ